MLTAVQADEVPHLVAVDAQALRASPWADRVRTCIRVQSGQELDEMRDGVGFDPLEDVDRFVVTDDVFVMEGRFGGADWLALPEEMTRVLGPDGIAIYQGRRGEEGENLAVLSDGLIVVGRKRAALDEALDRLAGRRPLGPAIPMPNAMGPVIASIKASTLVEGLPVPWGAREVASAALDAADLRATLTLSVGEDVDVSASIFGEPGTNLAPVTAALSGVLALLQDGADDAPEGRRPERALFRALTLENRGGALQAKMPVSHEVLDAFFQQCERHDL